MARYIDVDKFEDYVYDCAIRNVRVDCDRNCIECYYNNGGAEDVAPVIHAHWTEKEWAEEFDNRLISNYECSNCKEWLRDKSNYCPNCKAKMDRSD